MNRSSWLALCAEFGPIVLFFIAGKYSNFFTAVSLFMLSTVIATILSWVFDKRIPWLPIVSSIFVICGGSLTLWYHHPDAIIVADTLFYIFVSSVLAYCIFTNKLILKKLFGTIVGMTDDGWRQLAFRWFLFLLLCAGANEISRYLLTPEQWIDYRLYKTIVVALFAAYQITLVRRCRLSETTPWGLRRLGVK